MLNTQAIRQEIAEDAQKPSPTTIGKAAVGDGETIKSYTPQELVAVFNEMGNRESFLLLGNEGYIYRGWTTMLSGYAKAGKTTLLSRFIRDLPEGVNVLFICEEPPAIWGERIKDNVDAFNHVRFMPALNAKVEAILKTIQTCEEEIIIVDTIRNLLQLKDENDNSEVVRKLVPIIGAAQQQNKTLILTHHTRKGGGMYGEGAAGAGAFMGIVDVGLEIRRDSHDPDSHRREIYGEGRLHIIEPLAYELLENGELNCLGSPKSVRKNTVKKYILEVLSDGERYSAKDILLALGEDAPSKEQVRVSAKELVSEGTIKADTSAKEHLFWNPSPTTPLSIVVGEIQEVFGDKVDVQKS